MPPGEVAMGGVDEVDDLDEVDGVGRACESNSRFDRAPRA
jgi:hypothetical protein